MRLLATAFSLTLGVWRVRLSLDIDEVLHDSPLVLHDDRVARRVRASTHAGHRDVT